MWRLIDNNYFVKYFPYPDDASSIAAGIPLLTGSADGQPGWSTQSDCATLLPTESSSFGSSMLRWMRESDCFSNYDAYKSLHTPNFHPHTQNDTSWGDNIGFNPCELKGFNVDIYYRPVPGVDASCQITIGTGLEALQDGAITDAQGTVYWGYSLSNHLWSTPGRNQGPCPQLPAGNPGVPTQHSDSKSKRNLQPQNIEPGSPGNLNPGPGDSSPRLVTFAATAQN